MQRIKLPSLRSLSDGAEVIERDRRGPKVLRLSDGSFLKLFRRKKLFSSSTLYPYAQRFVDNAATLTKLGVPSPTPITLYELHDQHCDALRYTPLPGKTLRQLSAELPSRDVAEALGRFTAELHEQGIYFRSLHLGNIVLCESGRFGLIDVADMRCLGKPLTMFRRLRNFKHLLRYEEDRTWLAQDGADLHLIHAYNQAASVAIDDKKVLNFR